MQMQIIRNNLRIGYGTVQVLSIAPAPPAPGFVYGRRALGFRWSDRRYECRILRWIFVFTVTEMLAAMMLP
jgi:hypothetical protein